MGFFAWAANKIWGKPKRANKVVALINTDGKVIGSRPFTEDDDFKDFVQIGDGQLLLERSSADTGGRARHRKIPTSRKAFKEYYDGLSIDSGDFHDSLFKDLTPGAFVDTPKETHDRIVKLALLQYKKNARAFSIIEIVKDFVIGDDIFIDAADESVQELIDKFWCINEWDEKLEERVRSLAITGEQIYPVMVDESGMLRLSSILPLQVVEVLRDKENAEDIAKLTAAVSDKSIDYRTEQPNLSEDAVPFNVLKEYDAKRVEDGTLDLGDGRYCFFFAINRISGGTRGQSDLTPVMDWIEGMDSFVFTVLERAELAMQVVFDLKCEGLQKKELQEKADEFVSNLRAGEAYSHNEKVELKVHSPDIGSSEAQEIFNVLARMISSGICLPGMFFGDPMDVNRASAGESSIPPTKRLLSRQRFIKRMIRRAIDLQIAVAKQRKMLEGVSDFTYKIRMPRIMLRDMSMIARAIKGLADALSAALDREKPFVTAELAHKIFVNALIDLDPAEDYLQAATREELSGEEMASLPDELKQIYELVRRERVKAIEHQSALSANNEEEEDDGESE